MGTTLQKEPAGLRTRGTIWSLQNHWRFFHRPSNYRQAKMGQLQQGYNKLCAPNGMIDNWPWKHIWRSKLPTKVICFSWIALRNATLTQDNLCRRSIQLVNRCYMCCSNTESVNYLSLHCSVASDIWNMFLAVYAIPMDIREAFEGWCSWKIWEIHKKNLASDPNLYLLEYMDRKEFQMFWRHLNFHQLFEV